MNAVPDDDPPMSVKAWYVYLWRRRTTLIGYAITGLGALATAGHFPVWAVDALLVASGGSVAGLGHLNNALLKRQQDTQPPDAPAQVKP